MRNALWAILLLIAANSQLWAQTEANMCVSVTDVCCDDNFSSAEYTIPAGQVIYKTYVYHKGNQANKVYIECWDIVNGQESFRFWALGNVCGCEEDATTENHQIGGNHTLRFKVKCKDCAGGNCAIGSSVVYIYSSPAAVTCPQPCQGN